MKTLKESEEYEDLEHRIKKCNNIYKVPFEKTKLMSLKSKL